MEITAGYFTPPAERHINEGRDVSVRYVFKSSIFIFIFEQHAQRLITENLAWDRYTGQIEHHAMQKAGALIAVTAEN